MGASAVAALAGAVVGASAALAVVAAWLWRARRDEALITRIHEQVDALLAATERQAAASEAAAKLVADPHPRPGSAHSPVPRSPGARHNYGHALADATAPRLPQHRPGETSLPITPPSTPSVHGIQSRPLLDHTLRASDDYADVEHVRAPGSEHGVPAPPLPVGGYCPSQPQTSQNTENMVLDERVLSAPSPLLPPPRFSPSKGYCAPL
eukprot:scaffold29487_cov131-Isochrysis_galbana.AAC.3